MKLGKSALAAKDAKAVRTQRPTDIREHERELIRLAREGNHAATRRLVDDHKDRLFAFIRRMVRNHHDAEEICQEAFLKAFASLDSYSSQYRFSTWLFTIGYRVCLNWLRRKRALTGEVDFANVPLTVSASGPKELIESEEAGKLKEVVWAAVDRLSTPQRATVVLFYRHEQSCQEIAHALSLPVATVKSHLHRARGRLREMLESALDQDDIGRLCNLAG
jgi:RNA polymerase sigma-70 factor (ECF subfamily)